MEDFFLLVKIYGLLFIDFGIPIAYGTYGLTLFV